MNYHYHRTSRFKTIHDQWGECVRGKRFVWLMMPEWDGLWTRQNHFALRLAEMGAHILYVEQPNALTRYVRQRHLPDHWRPTVRQAAERLHILTPQPVMPGIMRSDHVADLVGRQIGGTVSHFLQQNQWHDYFCWHRLPVSLYAGHHLNPAPVLHVYDITDDYASYVDGMRAERVRQREKALIAESALVLVTNEALLEAHCSQHANIVYLPNGVDYELFAQVGSGSVQKHPAVTDLRDPLIGYVGLIKDWLDLELLTMLGQRWPGQCLFIGPFAPAMEPRARNIPGIRWTGFVPRTELVGYLEATDVCIVPFRLSAVTRASSPLKIWEYMATGKPIVCFDLPMLRHCKDLVYVATDREHFVALIEHLLLNGEPPERDVARRELAQQYSWDVIFERLLKALNATLESSSIAKG